MKPSASDRTGIAYRQIKAGLFKQARRLSKTFRHLEPAINVRQ